MRSVPCPVCRRERQVNSFGRCQTCGSVVADERRSGKLGLYLKHWVKGLVPVVLLAAITYLAADAAWWSGRHSLLMRTLPGVGTSVVMGVVLVVGAPVLAALRGRQ